MNNGTFWNNKIKPQNDCPCWGCQDRGENCRTCQPYKEYEQKRNAKYKENIVNNEFSQYHYQKYTEKLKKYWKRRRK